MLMMMLKTILKYELIESVRSMTDFARSMTNMTDFGENKIERQILVKVWIDSRKRQAYVDQLVHTELLCNVGKQGARK